jgi:hypothetical protein
MLNSAKATGLLLPYLSHPDLRNQATLFCINYAKSLTKLISYVINAGVCMCKKARRPL